jgi:uncharacterized protein
MNKLTPNSEPLPVSTALPQIPPISSEPPSTIRQIFWGAHGLRAGWRFAIYIVLLVIGSFGINAAARAIFGRGRSAEMGQNPLMMITLEALLFLMFFVPAVLMSRLERRPLRVYGLGREGAFGKPFWDGALWGFVSLTVVLLVMRVSGVFYFGSMNTNLLEVLEYGVLWAIGFSLVGLAEEFGFRGYIQYTLTSGMGFWPAALLTSALFCAAHAGNPGETPLGLADVFASGLMLCVALWRTGSLWFPIGLHFGWNWAQSFFFGVADSGLTNKGHLFEGQSHGAAWLSGGTVGPEGSIFGLMMEGLMIAFILWRFKGVRYPDPESLAMRPGAKI